MSLQAAFELLLGQPRPLAGFDDLIWQSLSAGAASSKHPWNLGAITTIAPKGMMGPESRTVVMRRADLDSRSIDCHTDRRSQKFDHVTAWPSAAPIAWLFYEAATKIQLRLTGTATIIDDGADWESAWTGTPLRSRSAYVSVAEPGSRFDGDAPPDVSDRNVDLGESERGRDQFVIVRTQIKSADWLYLRREGHVRASFTYDTSGAASATWLVP